MNVIDESIRIESHEEYVRAVFAPTGITICGAVYIKAENEWEAFSSGETIYSGDPGNLEHVEMFVLKCADNVLARNDKRAWVIRNIPRLCPRCTSELYQDLKDNTWRCGAGCSWEMKWYSNT